MYMPNMFQINRMIRMEVIGDSSFTTIKKPLNNS